ncbi:MAG: thioredoxin domain-containing protein [Candidatus Paceibacterota bacterium]
MEQKQSFALNAPVAILIAGLFIAGAIVYSNSPNKNIQNNPNGNDAAQVAKDITVEPVSEKDHILGDPKAKVVLVVYTDFECPFCKMFHNTIQQVYDNYKSGGKVAIVYREFPLTQLHSKAAKEAEASECAADQGGNDAYWKFVNRLYEITPSNNGLDSAQLPKIAQNIGLNVDTFNDCLSSGKFTQKVKDSVTAAVKAGGQGSPYSVIVANGKNTPFDQGAAPFETMKQVLDDAIAGK